MWCAALPREAISPRDRRSDVLAAIEVKSVVGRAEEKAAKRLLPAQEFFSDGADDPMRAQLARSEQHIRLVKEQQFVLSVARRSSGSPDMRSGATRTTAGDWKCGRSNCKTLSERRLRRRTSDFERTASC
jgi:hypothetical protein